MNVYCSDLSKDRSGKLLQKPTYLEQFLEPLLSRQQLVQTSPRLLPERSHQIQLIDDNAKNFTILRDHWRGWICSACCTMNRRKDYNKLVCACGQSFISSPQRVRLDQVAGDEFLSLSAEDESPHKFMDDKIVQVVQTEFSSEFAIYTWELGPEAKIMGLYPRSATNEILNGNDAVFEELQEKNADRCDSYGASRLYR